MTETDWLAATDPERMLRFISTYQSSLPSGHLPTDRKLRLFVETAGCPACHAFMTGDRAANAVYVAQASCGTPAGKAALLRDLFGNPWRPADPFRYEPDKMRSWLRWGDGTVPRIAQAICDGRLFDRMGELADALEDAGSDNEDILMHCRGRERCGGCLGVGPYPPLFTGHHRPPCSVCDGTGWRLLRGPHVRGCWVLDLLRGLPRAERGVRKAE